MNVKKVKILYIAGLGRSGSTLLAKLLGELSGFMNVGEAARYLFNAKMVSEDLPCGCGNKISDCPFWNNIATGIDRDVQEFGKDVLRIRCLPLLMSPIQPYAFRRRMEFLLSRLESLYASIAEKAGCDVIVDSSKHPAIAYVLAQIPSIELCVIHLVRDPQGVVYSWSKPKEYLRAFSPLTVISRWMAFNLASELLRLHAKKYWLIRYEDLVFDPKGVVEKISSSIAGQALDMGFLHGTQARIHLQHALAGNPDKLSRGTLHIKARKWHLPWHVRLFILIFTLPLIHRYQYLFPKAS
jgi:hypothetical protein